MAKLAFIIASHKHPAQVLRLVRTLRHSPADTFCLIHHDPAGEPLDTEALAALSGVHCLANPLSVGWGEFSVVESELLGMRWLLQNAVPFDWLILLSGQDYPLQPIEHIAQTLGTADCDAFIEHFPALAPPEHLWNWGAELGRERYWYRYYTAPAALKPLFYKLYRLVNWQPWLRLRAGRFGAKVALRRRSPFSEHFQCYAGSQWHMLNRRCVEYVDECLRSQPHIPRYYRHTLVPDESFFQTVLANNPELRLCGHPRRYVRWQPPYPAILRSADFQELVACGDFFGRKFDITVDSEILDRLDCHLQGVPSSPPLA